MSDELTLDDLQSMARYAGLQLTDDELQGLLPGVNRARRQLAALRALIVSADEPAGVFIAASRK